MTAHIKQHSLKCAAVSVKAVWCTWCCSAPPPTISWSRHPMWGINTPKNHLPRLPGHAGGGCEHELTSDLLLLTACRPEALRRSMLEVVLCWHVIYLTVMTQSMSNRGFYKSETSQWTASWVRSIFNCDFHPLTLCLHTIFFFNHDQDWKISLCCGSFTDAPSTTSAWWKGPDTHKSRIQIVLKHIQKPERQSDTASTVLFALLCQ